jgi:hypothetical protein
MDIRTHLIGSFTQGEKNKGEHGGARAQEGKTETDENPVSAVPEPLRWESTRVEGCMIVSCQYLCIDLVCILRLYRIERPFCRIVYTVLIV